jgi:uncharacterized protein (DUF4213/DUF364 family)
MMFIDDLIEHAHARAPHKIISDVRVGLGYTGVLLDDESCGLAFTFTEDLGECCGILDEAGSLTGRIVAELLPWAKSGDRVKASIGLAAINACLNTDKTEWKTGNVINALEVGPDVTFGMIGEFRPILAEIRKKTDRIYVFEKHPGNASVYASETIPEHLPKCDVVVVTSTSIINQTFEEIVPYFSHARQVCMVGPSTPLCPEVFKRYNVSLLAGVVVTDKERIFHVISQCGGTMYMKGAIKQVMVKV